MRARAVEAVDRVDGRLRAGRAVASPSTLAEDEFLRRCVVGSARPRRLDASVAAIVPIAATLPLEGGLACLARCLPV